MTTSGATGSVPARTSRPIDFEIRRDDLRQTRAVSGDRGNVRIDRFALTANNVTYGVLGDALRYWSFFPSSEPGWGRVPVWGLGTVLATGETIYGYFPMSSEVTLDLDEHLVDRSAHRSALPETYNRYQRLPADTPRLDELLVLRPLFGTSFLLADVLREVEGTLVLSSASAKTAYGLAHLVAQPVVGLTSERNRAFVESLGVYDRVLPYGEVDELASVDGPLVYVDVSGDRGVRDAVRRVAGDRLRRDVVVGATHWQATGGGLGDAGTEAFFAPSHLEALTASLGRAELQRRMGTAWDTLLERSGDWMELQHSSGPDELARVWTALVDGDVDPRRAHIVTLA